MADSKCGTVESSVSTFKGRRPGKERSAPALWSETGLVAVATGGCEEDAWRGEGAEDETNNSKFAKRTWNVPWNQQFHFLASHLSIADWGGGYAGRCWREAQRRRGGIAADVDRQGVKRTARHILLKVKEISAFVANELH